MEIKYHLQTSSCVKVFDVREGLTTKCFCIIKAIIS